MQVSLLSTEARSSTSLHKMLLVCLCKEPKAVLTICNASDLTDTAKKATRDKANIEVLQSFQSITFGHFTTVWPLPVHSCLQVQRHSSAGPTIDQHTPQTPNVSGAISYPGASTAQLHLFLCSLLTWRTWHKHC